MLTYYPSSDISVISFFASLGAIFVKYINQYIRSYPSFHSSRFRRTIVRCFTGVNMHRCVRINQHDRNDTTWPATIATLDGRRMVAL